MQTCLGKCKEFEISLCFPFLTLFLTRVPLLRCWQAWGGAGRGYLDVPCSSPGAAGCSRLSPGHVPGRVPGQGGAPRFSAVFGVPWGTAQAEIFLALSLWICALPVPWFLRGQGCSLPSCHTEPRLGLFWASSPGDIWERADLRTLSCAYRTLVSRQQGLK